MSINIANVEIEPKRQTFGHIAERFGEDRQASRYEEAVYDGQATENFHYRPQWEPEFEIYDVKRTKIVMSDWYKLLDPRKYHYMTYVSARAGQNSASIQNFNLIEKRGLSNKLSSDVKERVYQYLTPLRHYFYGVNLNNLTIVARGYGTSFTSASLFYASDSLGLAQHITKMSLMLSNNDVSILDNGKDAWMNDSKWQNLRKMMEDIMVMKDPIEIFIAQNVALNGFIIPSLINEFAEKLAEEGAVIVSMLTEFITAWQEETMKWIDYTVKVMAEESSENKDLLSSWSTKYIQIAEEATKELVNYSNEPQKVIATTKENLVARLTKIGLSV